LIHNVDPYEPAPEPLAVRSDGVLAPTRDAAGAVLLDLSSRVEFLHSAAPRTVRHEEFRTDDPLGVGTSEEYCVHLQLLLPGDEVEAVGRVVIDRSGTPRLLPQDDRLLLCVVRGSS
jgi:hypothetical protein